MLSYILYIGAGISSILGLYTLYKTKKIYEKRRSFTIDISISWWLTDIAWITLVALSSLYNVWPLSIETAIASVIGILILALGIILTLAGVLEFRSLHKISGMYDSKLITTGVYSWSRNPQFLGFYLALLGTSLLGKSGYALLLTVIAIIYCHYYIVEIEEPHLEHIFGAKYISYKLRTPRYIGFRRINDNSGSK